VGLTAFRAIRQGRRLWRIALILVALAGIAVAGFIVWNGMAPTAKPGAGSTARRTQAAAAHICKTRAPASKPAWGDLTPAQQTALAPLAPEWDELETARKNKWLAIGNQFATMSSAEQQRVQKRMSEWVQLTPQQRRIARDSYSRAKKLAPNQKSARWQQYQELPDEQKEKLANSRIDKRVATLPPAHNKNKTGAPIKSTHRPELEQALTPKPAPPPPPPISLPPSNAAAAPVQNGPAPASVLAPSPTPLAPLPPPAPAEAPAAPDPTQY
jgi:hypothetical protein